MAVNQLYTINLLSSPFGKALERLDSLVNHTIKEEAQSCTTLNQCGTQLFTLKKTMWDVKRGLFCDVRSGKRKLHKNTKSQFSTMPVILRKSMNFAIRNESK